jgi:hypothetical protein
MTARAPELILHDIQLLLHELRDAARPTAVPGLLLSRAECNAIEETTGIGTTRTGGELQKAVERLASMKIGDIRIPFTPGQLSELAHRAQKRGRTVEAEMKAAVARIEEEIFYNKGA